MNKYLLIICAACLVALYLLKSKCNSERKSRSEIEANLLAANDTIKYKTDREGALHAVISAKEGTLKDLRVTDGKLIDSVLNRLKITANQLEEAQKAIVRLNASFHDYVDVTRRGDTVGTVDHVTPFDSYHSVEVDSAGVHIQYVSDTQLTPIHLTEYTKRAGIFKPTIHMIDGYSDNPNVRITGLNSVLVAKERPKANSYIKGAGVGIIIGLLLHLLIH